MKIKELFDHIETAERKGHRVQVRELYAELLKRGQHGAGTWISFAESLMGVLSHGEAEEALNRAAACLDADMLPFWFSSRGRLLEGMGRYEEALEAWLEAHRWRPDHASFLKYAGLISLQLGRTDTAEELLRQAVRCGGGAIDEAYYSLGLVLITKRNYRQAAECFTIALDMDPNYRAARKRLQDLQGILDGTAVPSRMAELGKKQFDELVDLAEEKGHKVRFRELHTALPGSRMDAYPGQHLTYASVLMDVMAYGEAEAALDRAEALMRRNDRHYVLNLRGRLLESTGRFGGAVEAWLEAHRLRPDYTGYLLYAGIACHKMGRMDQAEDLLRQATRCPDGYPDEAFYNLGVLLLSKRCYHDAAGCFRRALEIDPDYTSARKRLADLISVMGHMED
ncbi:MAG: photosystem assembly protein Ycf3 [Verrucomicrobiales bacterium]|nr:photosystem assembly protein Ycf3 [Verrucomicrobiales bacterium]